jgi:hypothetical protein
MFDQRIAQSTTPDLTPLQLDAPELRPLQSDGLRCGFDHLYPVDQYVDLNADSPWKPSNVATQVPKDDE